MAMAISNAFPIVKDGACMKALGPLRAVFPRIINEPGKLMRVAQVITKSCGEAGMTAALANLFQCLFTSLMREDVRPIEVTNAWLVGQATGPPGFAALCLVKKQILEFMFRAVHLSVEH